MKAKCIHCSSVNDHSDEEMKQFYLSCRYCGKQYRFSETKPILTEDHSFRGLGDNDSQGKFGALKLGKSRKPNMEDKIHIHNSRGTSYFKLGRLSQAYNEFKLSLQIQPNQDKVLKIMNKIEEKMREQGIEF